MRSRGPYAFSAGSACRASSAIRSAGLDSLSGSTMKVEAMDSLVDSCSI